MRKLIIAASIGLVFAATPALAADKAPAAAAASAIVDGAFVADALKHGAIVWDVRSADAYGKGHIPGAVNMGDIGKVLRDENSEDYTSLDKIEQLFGSTGIDPAKEIIVYGDKANPYVYFGLVTLQYFGAKNAHIYHGGLDDWKAAGNPVATEPTAATPMKVTLKVDPNVTVSTQDVIKSLKRKDVQIVDVRTPKEYSGEDIRALRGGHVTGAINIPYEQNWVDPDTPKKLAEKKVANKDGLALKPKDDLKALYGKLDPSKETIVYCQSGVRASETATVLRDLGFKKVKVYDSSWLGYGNTLNAPADDVNFFNVGALNGRIAAMQKHIELLEKQVAELSKGK
jgi:thiosulfate/3-mercaptopyruvate sulfurtransferase